MPSQLHTLVAILVAVAVGAGLAYRTTDPLQIAGSSNGADYSIRAVDRGGPLLEDDVRRGGLTFAPEVSALDTRAILEAVAAARPEARRLIDLVDGMVTVKVAPLGSLGEATGRRGRYTVTLDMPAVYALGKRGISRVVLHELGHVVDFAILPDDLIKTLDAGIPAGWPCPEGQPIGACAELEERFAETFAKWATGDIGIGLYAGYAVPPPPLLDEWGAPLAAFGA